MKNGWLFAAFILFRLYSTAQCTNCNSLTEALKDPARVKHLDLANQGLKELPDSIRFMTGLETIDLSENFLATIDLKDIRLENVYQLNLTGNIGLDPLELERISKTFPNLLTLNISNCGIAYLTPAIGTFKELLSLDLSDNKLVFLPEELKQLKQLNTLNIRHNNLTDITYVLSNCWNLRNLDAAENPFNPNALLISVGMFEKLEHLAWSYAELNRDGMAALAELPLRSMELIDATGNTLPPALMRNLYISDLTLTNGQFTGDISSALQEMPNLRKLTLRNTDMPSKLPKVTRLSTLTLENVPYPSTGTLAKFDFLSELDLTLVDVPDSVTRELPQLLKNTNVRTSYFAYSPEMITNTMPPVIHSESAVEQQIPGDKPVQLVVETVTLDVPENAFLNADGSVYSGQVTVKVTNYDNAISNALAGAPMIYNNNGQNEVFASSGMFDFRASDAAGNELKANPASQIQVTMVNQQPQASPNLYTFDDLAKQWIEAMGRPAPYNLDSVRNVMIDSVNRMDLNEFINFQTIPTPFELQVRDKRWDPATLDFTYIQRPDELRRDAGTFTTRFYQENQAAQLIADKTWRIDTLVTPELMAKLMEIQCSKKRRRSSDNYNNTPRLIQDLTVVPDFENDNYRMSFRYKDTLISVPVFLQTKKGQGRSVMVAYAKFQKAFDKALAKDRREQQEYSATKEAMIAGLSPGIRDSLINSIRTSDPRRIEQLRFSMPGFGLVNCDFFARNRPDLYTGLSQTISDQDGEEIETPDFVRTILPKSNVYLSAERDKIPQYASEKTLLLLVISATEIGLIKLENLLQKGKINTFQRISIEGKSTTEVANIIENY